MRVLGSLYSRISRPSQTEAFFENGKAKMENKKAFQEQDQQASLLRQPIRKLDKLFFISIYYQPYHRKL